MTTEKPLPIGNLIFNTFSGDILVGKSMVPTDYFDKNHPLVVKYTKDLKNVNQELKAIIEELMSFICKVSNTEETHHCIEAEELRSKYYEFIKDDK
jgi:hypothetical protein